MFSVRCIFLAVENSALIQIVIFGFCQLPWIFGVRCSSFSVDRCITPGVIGVTAGVNHLPAAVKLWVPGDA